MRLFESADRINELSNQVARGGETASCASVIELAWFLRQCQPERAEQLVTQVLPRLQPEDVLLTGRAQLIAADQAFLAGKFELALSCLDALSIEEPMPELASLCADAWLLRSQIGSETGDQAAWDRSIANARQCAQRVSDFERVLFLDAIRARQQALGDAVAAKAEWSARFDIDSTALPQAVTAAVAGFRSILAYNLGDWGVAVRELELAFELQSWTGQLPAAIVNAGNLSDAYALLNDHDTALEWAQRALDLAESKPWPGMRAYTLQRMGENMLNLGRVAEAMDFLDRAMTFASCAKLSRSYINLLSSVGEAALAAGKLQLALEKFAEQVDGAARLAQRDLVLTGMLGKASALLKLGHFSDAEKSALEALELARAHGVKVYEINILRLLAQIATQRGDAEGTLAQLQTAREVASRIDRYIVPPDLLAELAAALANVGDYAAAYRTSLEVDVARQAAGKRQAEQRIHTLQARMESERARAEALQERQRAELLQQTSTTLEHISAIGQEITAQLDKERVFESIDRHVHGLLDAQCFSIYLMDGDGRGLTSVFDVENGERLPPDHVALDDPHSNCARCVVERTERRVNFSEVAPDASYIPGTLYTLSALFAPLSIGERVLGVMTIQSVRPQAYGDKECLIFRTLCAYAAIALDNAVAYSHLRDTQTQLVAQEKMAALGALVAGVAHELNTPIGNAMLVASTVHDRNVELAGCFERGELKRSALSSYLAEAAEATSLIQRNLATAAELVQTFKEVAVDRATEKRRKFDLQRTSHDILATLARRIEISGHLIELNMPEGLEIDAYPGPYGQVITNLVDNAIIHAFAGKSCGRMRLEARLLKHDRVEVCFSDDGCGIGADNLSRIFDPFFTTRFGQGGSGLGLSICYNIATSLFGGNLHVVSPSGGGAQFVWTFPRVAPQQPATDTSLL